MSQIEEIAEYDDGSKVWRTTCKCMGDDHLTFTVDTDDYYSEVYLEFWVDHSSGTWNEPFWKRMKWKVRAIKDILFKGYIKTTGAFIFRGSEHIDEFCDTIQTHKEYMIKLKGELNE